MMPPNFCKLVVPIPRAQTFPPSGLCFKYHPDINIDTTKSVLQRLQQQDIVLSINEVLKNAALLFYIKSSANTINKLVLTKAVLMSQKLVIFQLKATF
jgi:hypothetical protein